jgi:hypothetical protein
MKKAILAAAAVILVSAAPGYAQTTSSPQPSGGTESIIRTPSSNGQSSGDSGRIGSPIPSYPAPLRDFNNPAASYGNNYGRFGNPNAGVGARRR